MSRNSQNYPAKTVTHHDISILYRHSRQFQIPPSKGWLLFKALTRTTLKYRSASTASISATASRHQLLSRLSAHNKNGDLGIWAATTTYLRKKKTASRLVALPFAQKKQTPIILQNTCEPKKNFDTNRCVVFSKTRKIRQNTDIRLSRIRDIRVRTDRALYPCRYPPPSPCNALQAGECRFGISGTAKRLQYRPNYKLQAPPAQARLGQGCHLGPGGGLCHPPRRSQYRIIRCPVGQASIQCTDYKQLLQMTNLERSSDTASNLQMTHRIEISNDNVGNFTWSY